MGSNTKMQQVAGGDTPFASAVRAVIGGDLARLDSLLRDHPDLVRARGADGATLLHYVAANGVADEFQKSPANAASIARCLLDAGAEVDSTMPAYGGHHTTLSLLVSSAPPAAAGVQVELVEALVDAGAAIGNNVITALAHGHADAARILVGLGAPIDRLAVAAGLGLVERCVSLLAVASGEERHLSLALAAQHGRVEVVRLLLDAGEDPDRYNPSGAHAHSTPLHQAALAGHEAVVRLLLDRGARTDLRDRVYSGTPADWARHGGHLDVAALLS